MRVIGHATHVEQEFEMSPFSSKIRALILGIIVSLTGCQSMMQSPSRSEAAGAAETIAVQLRPSQGKAKDSVVVLEPNMRLQDVVNASGAKYRNKLAYIVRTSPITGQNHKLEGHFGPNRRVSLETDYAIQPGDRVVITQDTSTSFDRVMKSLVGRS